jgi:RimJ/RimL family protein N-acetyltransferase
MIKDAIEFKRLTEVTPDDLITLMNEPGVRRLMPLSADGFDAEGCARFVAGKEAMWAEHGYGPWAFFIEGRFAGWGGLQPEAGDVDLGIVLHPDYWGFGKPIYDRLLTHAFGRMNLDSITVLLPPKRTRTRAVLRLGFERDGEVEIGGVRFLRYRLRKSMHESRHG